MSPRAGGLFPIVSMSAYAASHLECPEAFAAQREGRPVFTRILLAGKNPAPTALKTVCGVICGLASRYVVWHEVVGLKIVKIREER